MFFKSRKTTRGARYTHYYKLLLYIFIAVSPKPADANSKNFKNVAKRTKLSGI